MVQLIMAASIQCECFLTSFYIELQRNVWHQSSQSLNSPLVDMKWCRVLPVTNWLRKFHCSKSLRKSPSAGSEPAWSWLLPAGTVKWRWLPTTPCWDLPQRKSWSYRITRCLRSKRKVFLKPGKPQVNSSLLCGPGFIGWRSASLFCSL